MPPRPGLGALLAVERVREWLTVTSEGAEWRRR